MGLPFFFLNIIKINKYRYWNTASTHNIFLELFQYTILTTLYDLGLDHEAIPPSEDEISEGAGCNYTSMVSYQWCSSQYEYIVLKSDIFMGTLQCEIFCLLIYSKARLYYLNIGYWCKNKLFPSAYCLNVLI